MTREEKYRQQLKALGTYDEAFEPAIHTLAQVDRDLTRAKKEWAATVPRGCKPSMMDPHYALIRDLRREQLAHQEALGLTPKSLRKLRGAPEPPVQQDLITSKLSEIAARCASYSVPKLDTAHE